jgi:hypothetical protein
MQYMTQTATEYVRERRSVKLTKDEHRTLKAFRKTFDTLTECAMAFPIDRTVLGKVLLSGSGAPKTIEAIRKGLNKEYDDIDTGG